MLVREGVIYSERSGDMPDDIRAMLESLDILSVLVYPIFINRKMAGFIGYDESARTRRWDEREINV